MAQRAIGGLVLYLVVALGLRMLIQWRLTGSTGFQAISGKAGSLEWFAGVLPAVAILASAVSPVLMLSGVVQPLGILVSPAVQSAGLVLFVLGLSLSFAAQLQMGGSWRIGVKPGETTQLVTTGLFSVVRNPIFAAMLAAFLGLLLMAPAALGAGSWLLLLVALEIQVRFVEEPHLLRVHGNAYSNYASRVGRFLPGLGRL